MKRSLMLAAAIMAASSLSACGLTGSLARPDPLWGEPDDTLEPAELPEGGTQRLPELPDRDEDTEDAPDADDELLGGYE